MRIQHRHIVAAAAVLALVLALCGCDFLGSLFGGTGDPASKEDSAGTGYLKVVVWDLGTHAGKNLIVWIYADDTAPASMYGDGMFYGLLAQARIPLNSYGEGAGTVCYDGTTTPIPLSNAYYATFAFVDSNGDGEPTTGEPYALRDVNVNGDTICQFDDPDFSGYTIP
jgi:hypothetical protein